MINFTQTEVSLLRNELAPFRPALPPGIRAGFEEEPRGRRREPYGTAMTRVTETSSEIKLTEKDIANALEHIRILIKAKMTKEKDRRALLKLQSSLAAVGSMEEDFKDKQASHQRLRVEFYQRIRNLVTEDVILGDLENAAEEMHTELAQKLTDFTAIHKDLHFILITLMQSRK